MSVLAFIEGTNTLFIPVGESKIFWLWDVLSWEDLLSCSSWEAAPSASHAWWALNPISVFFCSSTSQKNHSASGYLSPEVLQTPSGKSSSHPFLFSLGSFSVFLCLEFRPPPCSHGLLNFKIFLLNHTFQLFCLFVFLDYLLLEAKGPEMTFWKIFLFSYVVCFDNSLLEACCLYCLVRNGLKTT